jgi:hypothetical protein
MLGIDMWEKVRLQDELPRMHLRLHLLEVANWLPWPLTLATLGALSWRRSKTSAGAGAPPDAAA